MIGLLVLHRTGTLVAMTSYAGPLLNGRSILLVGQLSEPDVNSVHDALRSAGAELVVAPSFEQAGALLTRLKFSAVVVALPGAADAAWVPRLRDSDVPLLLCGWHIPSRDFDGVPFLMIPCPPALLTHAMLCMVSKTRLGAID